MTKTFESIIEAHRVAVGAEKVHVTLGPDATPEGVEAGFAKLRQEAAAFEGFPVEERQLAFIARLRGTLRKIDGLAHEKDFEGIVRLTDMIVDVDMVEDLRYLAAEREKRKEPLPAGVAEILAHYEARDKERAVD